MPQSAHSALMSLNFWVTESRRRVLRCCLNFSRPFVRFHDHRMPRPCLRFLGMVNFFHRFLPHAATLMGPLHGMSHTKGQAFSLSETPPLPPSTPLKDTQDAHSRTSTQLRIVGRSRSGRVIRLPAKLHTVVAGATGGSPVAA